MTDADRKAMALGTQSADQLLNPPKPREAPPDADPRPLLLAIGDSWFNYWPRGDILDLLEDQGFEIRRCAKAGRQLAEMLYADPKVKGSLNGEAIAWLVANLKNLGPADRSRLQAVLISAGGNDVAGNPETLKKMVQPKNAVANGSSPLDDAGVAAFVDGELRGMFVSLLACINRTFEKAGLSKVPILLHGYSNPVPDGRGVLGTSWLQEPLRKLGYTELDDGTKIMGLLIERLNVMQQSLKDIATLGNVVQVDVRRALHSDRATYKVYWQNELHPTIPFGFGEITKVFGAKMMLLAAQASSSGESAPDAKSSASPRTSRRPPPARPTHESRLHDPA
jgi:hypothetical protein